MNTIKKQKVKRERLSAEVRRKQLLDLAIIETAKNGIGQARHADIASASGVAVSTVFFYFSNVEALTNAVIDDIEKTFLSILNVFNINLNKNENELISLDTFIEKYDFHLNQIIKEKPDHVVICLEWGSSSKNSMWSRYLGFRAQQIKVITEYFSRLQSCDAISKSHHVETIAILAISFSRMILTMKTLGDTDEATSEVFKCLKAHLQN